MPNNYRGRRKIDRIGLLNDIETQVLEMCDTEKESLSEAVRYVREFPREPDFMIAKHGCLLCYIDQVRDLYRAYGYKNIDDRPQGVIWDAYCRDVGYAVRALLSRRNLI